MGFTGLKPRASIVRAFSSVAIRLRAGGRGNANSARRGSTRHKVGTDPNGAALSDFRDRPRISGIPPGPPNVFVEIGDRPWLFCGFYFVRLVGPGVAGPMLKKTPGPA